MEQLTQLLKNGEMQLLEVPYPFLSEGQVLVRNHFSVISAGTEGKTVHDARLGYIGKARARRDELKKVVGAVRTYGLAGTYKMVMNKLETPSPLGYSCAGVVMAVADDVTAFCVGDRVACGGNTAHHAEVVAVPLNLCVPVSDLVSLQDAAFCTLGSVALQGIRQADLKLGENAVVIGLGLIGQLTIQMLQAAGVRTAGIDVKEDMIELARQSGCELALNRYRQSLEETIMNFTDGHGADAVIITAGASNADPVDLAGVLCRQKGKVVIVGSVPTGFRRTHYYRKELDLRMSCSYGPGRYDSNYEERGIDYPVGYVRWTENRNMKAFIALLERKKIVLDKLITHRFDFREAAEAYRLVLDKAEPYAGIVLNYDISSVPLKEIPATGQPRAGKVRAGMIGAGSFAQNFLIPNLPAHVAKTAIATAHGNTAAHAAAKFGFGYATTDALQLIADQNVNTVFIATRHDRHAEFTLASLRSGKHVFAEKPLALTPGQLDDIRLAYQDAHGGEALTGPSLMVGFNRRFAPLVQRMISALDAHLPKSVHYRINAGKLPPGHWTLDPKTGGGRIVGEVCHFVDLAAFIAGSAPVSVHAFLLRQKPDQEDTLTINLSFANGSIAGISYFSNGNRNLSKEYLEVFCGGAVAQLTDFKELVLWKSGRERHRLSKSDKGHAACIQAFASSIADGSPSPVPFNELYTSSLLPFRIIESIRTGQAVDI